MARLEIYSSLALDMTLRQLADHLLTSIEPRKSTGVMWMVNGNLASTSLPLQQCPQSFFRKFSCKMPQVGPVGQSVKYGCCLEGEAPVGRHSCSWALQVASRKQFHSGPYSILFHMLLHGCFAGSPSVRLGAMNRVVRISGMSPALVWKYQLLHQEAEKILESELLTSCLAAPHVQATWQKQD